MTRDDMIKAIEEMTVLELSELVKALEEKFGVSAAAPVAMPMMAMPGAGAAAAAEEEKTEFDVIYKAPGANKINVIKVEGPGGRRALPRSAGVRRFPRTGAGIPSELGCCIERG